MVSRTILENIANSKIYGQNNGFSPKWLLTIGRISKNPQTIFRGGSQARPPLTLAIVRAAGRKGKKKKCGGSTGLWGPEAVFLFETFFFFFSAFRKGWKYLISGSPEIPNFAHTNFSVIVMTN